MKALTIIATTLMLGSLVQASEKKVEVSVSGDATIETEQLKRYGFNGTFGNSPEGAGTTYNINTFLARLNLDLKKGTSSLVTKFDIGEIYFGDTNTGGAVGDRSSGNLKVKEAHLLHNFNEQASFSGGIHEMIPDTRGFVFYDYISSYKLSYSKDNYSGYIWYGISNQNRPTADRSLDQYVGYNGSLVVSEGITVNPYVISRNQTGASYSDGTTSVSGNQDTLWVGATADFDWSPTKLQLTAINNSGQFKVPNNGPKGNISGYLFDVVVSYDIKGWNTSLEYLMTSGAKDAKDNNGTLIDKIKHFQSYVDLPYLLTLAGNDGIDDEAGTLRNTDYVIGGLSNPAGISYLVAKVEGPLTESTTLMARYGLITLRNKDETATGTSVGSEIDVRLTHTLSEETTVMADYAILDPGNAFASDAKNAELMSLRMKYSF